MPFKFMGSEPRSFFSSTEARVALALYILEDIASRAVSLARARHAGAGIFGAEDDAEKGSYTLYAWWRPRGIGEFIHVQVARCCQPGIKEALFLLSMYKSPVLESDGYSQRIRCVLATIPVAPGVSSGILYCQGKMKHYEVSRLYREKMDKILKWISSYTYRDGMRCKIWRDMVTLIARNKVSLPLAACSVTSCLEKSIGESIRSLNVSRREGWYIAEAKGFYLPLSPDYRKILVLDGGLTRASSYIALARVLPGAAFGKPKRLSRDYTETVLELDGAALYYRSKIIRRNRSTGTAVIAVERVIEA